ncbi:YajQ family cyclic di-GMP-binding protein [Glaciecola sp. MH2013]|uniref:YajQ family cyclic di-GMP-binding protein n=1 Tax=Glaciecola sp. MH2013 TaxID=2785524 RepID=UPI0018A0F9BA|nr:YajQ family cyclic di-GMP-binding protein [Glaciecola sp. MH2013]MBF7074651.1 YajQ family cyclic di-GMP-binding protein [Glaciecola sp. MH2013]
MPSFDIVSELNSEEVRNATENASRELSTRFDFRGVEASFEFKDDTVIMKAESEFQLKQMMDILRNALVKRGVDTSSMDRNDSDHSGKTHKQTIGFKQGIDQPLGKKIVKLIKDKKLKVQTAIQGEQLRVTGKKRDDLQAVMAFLKQEDLGQPLQFTNFRD